MQRLRHEVDPENRVFWGLQGLNEPVVVFCHWQFANICERERQNKKDLFFLEKIFWPKTFFLHKIVIGRNRVERGEKLSKLSNVPSSVAVYV